MNATVGINCGIEHECIWADDRSCGINEIGCTSLKKTEGNINIVNVSSTGGMVPVKYAFYGIFKAALDQFTQIAANEFDCKKMRVNSANPLFVINTNSKIKSSSILCYCQMPEKISTWSC